MNDFLHVIGECSRRYMATGGPTTRLEERIIQAGITLGFQCEVYATPTAIFITAKHGRHVVTNLERTTDNHTNFTDMLVYDSILEQLSLGTMNLEDAKKALEEFDTRRYPVGLVSLSAFMIGFVSSYPRYGSLLGAIGSGIIATLVYILNRPLSRKLKFSGVFNDFIGSFLAFVLSVLCAAVFNMAPSIFVIGSIILIVPGLTLTTAISELAEHNFVSGTVKMMKSILILVAMGVAYLLVDNMVHSLQSTSSMALSQSGEDVYFQLAPSLQVLFRVIMIASFCIFFHIPTKAFAGAIVCGLLSILVLDQFKDHQLFVLASYSASLTVGLVSLGLARLYNWPSQVFATTGILSLVPGLLALSSFYSLVDNSAQGAIAYRVSLTAGAITFGLFTARMPFRFYNTVRNLPVTR